MCKMGPDMQIGTQVILARYGGHHAEVVGNADEYAHI